MRRRVFKFRWRGVGVFATLEVMPKKPWQPSHYALHAGINKLKSGYLSIAQWQYSTSVILRDGKLKLHTF